jgi:hypothetical protein
MNKPSATIEVNQSYFTNFYFFKIKINCCRTFISWTLVSSQLISILCSIVNIAVLRVVIPMMIFVTVSGNFVSNYDKVLRRLIQFLLEGRCQISRHLRPAFRFVPALNVSTLFLMTFICLCIMSAPKIINKGAWIYTNGVQILLQICSFWFCMPVPYLHDVYLL